MAQNKVNILEKNDTKKSAPDSIEFYPFAYALFNENLSTYCWYCLDENKTHKRCSGCSIAVFCDKECQILSWKDHKFECKALKLAKIIPDIEIRLLGRIVAILNQKDKKDATFYKDRNSRRSIMEIWAHTENISNDLYAMNKFNTIYESLTKFYDSKALLSKEIIFQLHCRNFINRHAISDKAYIKEIGKGLYLDLCAYDHSCRPNAIYICNGFKANLRALNLKTNLVDRSTTFYSGKQERQKLLKDTWYFCCKCDRCQDNGEHILISMNCPHCKDSPPQKLCLFGEHSYKDPETQLITCSTCSTTLSKEEVMEALGAMRFIDEVLEKTKFEKMERKTIVDFLFNLLQRFEHLLPKINIYYCKIVQALIPFLDPYDNNNLLKMHLAVEECIRICYPHNHPALGFHLRNIGIFCLRLKDLKNSIKYLREAYDIFEFVMRSEHCLTITTKSFLDEALELKSEIQSKKKKKNCSSFDLNNIDNQKSSQPEIQIDFGTLSTEIKNVDLKFKSVKKTIQKSEVFAESVDKDLSVDIDVKVKNANCNYKKQGDDRLNKSLCGDLKNYNKSDLFSQPLNSNWLVDPDKRETDPIKKKNIFVSPNAEKKKLQVDQNVIENVDFVKQESNASTESNNLILNENNQNVTLKPTKTKHDKRRKNLFRNYDLLLESSSSEKLSKLSEKSNKNCHNKHEHLHHYNEKHSNTKHVSEKHQEKHRTKLAVPQLLISNETTNKFSSNASFIEINILLENQNLKKNLPITNVPSNLFIDTYHDSISNSTGVKKKAAMKKISPRARTPIPSFNSNEDALGDITTSPTLILNFEEAPSSSVMFISKLSNNEAIKLNVEAYSGKHSNTET